MSPKQTALVKTSKFILTGLVTGFVIGVLFNLFHAAQVLAALAVLVIIYCIKYVYDMNLSEAETLDKLNKISRD